MNIFPRNLGLYPLYLKMHIYSTPVFIHGCVVPLCRERPCASSRLALNENRRTLKHAFPSITGITKHVILLLLINMLVACSSNSSQRVTFYTLNSADTQASTSRDLAKPLVVIDDVSLSAILDQQGLVISQADNKVYTATYHQWAELLDHAIATSLVQKLSIRSQQYRFELPDGSWNSNNQFTIRLTISDFNATDSGKVINRGQYWIYDGEQTLMHTDKFSIEQQPRRDGYAETVYQLSLSMDDLADKIVASLQQL